MSSVSVLSIPKSTKSSHMIVIGDELSILMLVSVIHDGKWSSSLLVLFIIGQMNYVKEFNKLKSIQGAHHIITHTLPIINNAIL